MRSSPLTWCRLISSAKFTASPQQVAAAQLSSAVLKVMASTCGPCRSVSLRMWAARCHPFRCWAWACFSQPPNKPGEVWNHHAIWGRSSSHFFGAVDQNPVLGANWNPKTKKKNMFEICLKPPPSIWLPPPNHWCSPGSLLNCAFASGSAPLPRAMVLTAPCWHWGWHRSWWRPAAASHRWSLRTAARAAARRRSPGASFRCCWWRCSSSHWSPAAPESPEIGWS